MHYTFVPKPLDQFCDVHVGDIHPTSRGVAAHTAGLFRSVRGATGGLGSFQWVLLSLFHAVGASQAREFSLFPFVGASQAREFSLFPPVGASQAKEFSLFPPVQASQGREFSLFPPVEAPKLGNFPPPAKADIATAILTNVIEHLV